jgi:hypothetical protein
MGKTVDSKYNNTNFTPTSALQDAYGDLREYLSLRTSEELLNKISPGAAPVQLDDSQSKRTLAMASILSPDGAFFTKDIPDVLRQMNLQPRDDARGTGDINVYGASAASADNKYGGKILDVLGIDTKKFKLDPGTTSDSLYTQAESINKRLKEITAQRTKISQEQIALLASIKSADATKSATLQAQYDQLQTQYTALGKESDGLAEQVTAVYRRAGDFQISKLGIRDALSKNVNVDQSLPNPPYNTHLSFYRHVAQYLDPTSAASDYCNVFFNAIDSINMSMCVPFFRLNIIDRFAKKKSRHSKISLSAFLRQTVDSAGDKIFYEAEPFTTNSSVAVANKTRSGKVIGTEIFFAPQTLLPDPTEILSNPRRLDTSVPLLSLNSFSISIESVGIALLSKKVADLSITLHDRSRLADITPLVSSGNFSSLYFEIEWGWAHPHGEAKFDNPVARYLNALRYREVFSPVSYNMTMSDGGAMNITMRLIGGASLDAVNGSILNGGFLTRTYATQMLDKLIKSEIAAEEGAEASVEDIRTVTSVLIDKSRTAHMVDGTFVEALWAYVNSDDRTLFARERLIIQLQDILKQSEYYKNEEIFDIIRKNMPTVSSYAPASNVFDILKSEYGSQVDDKDFTSVASYLALLVGMPLASTGLYSEVQIHTFKFNSAAGAMAGKQISDAPIRVADVFRHPDQEGSLAQNTSITNALTLLGNYLSNPKQPLYGIASTAQYSAIKVDETQRETGDPAAAPDKKAKDAADDFEKPPDFTTPNIRCFIRSVPAKEYKDEQKKTIADYVVNPEKLIAQVIVYDANSSPNFNKIIGAYSYGKFTNLKDKKITPDFAKDIFKSSFPSVIYGATNSMLKSVNVTTDINNAIATQNILDAAKDQYLGRSKSDVSSDVSEITLFPGAVTVSMIGLPIIERGQEVYLDLGTGTTLDALYYVSAVKHDFRPGEFTTNLTLTYKGQGSVMSLTTMLQNFYETLPEGQKSKRLLELQQRADEQSASIDAKADAERPEFDAEREANLSASLTKTK